MKTILKMSEEMHLPNSVTNGDVQMTFGGTQVAAIRLPVDTVIKLAVTGKG